VYSQFHQQLMKADPYRDGRRQLQPGARRAHSPPGRVRGRAAHALASAASRLDRERARRALA
jgi:hypothetical protein